MRDAVHGEGVEPDLFWHDGMISERERVFVAVIVSLPAWRWIASLRWQ
jgi:hypothetical protein